MARTQRHKVKGGGGVLLEKDGSYTFVRSGKFMPSSSFPVDAAEGASGRKISALKEEVTIFGRGATLVAFEANIGAGAAIDRFLREKAAGRAPVPPQTGSQLPSPAPPASPSPPPPPPPAPPAAPAGWHPDPLHRAEQRYWDGTLWTEHVSTEGVQSIDPAGGG